MAEDVAEATDSLPKDTGLVGLDRPLDQLDLTKMLAESFDAKAEGCLQDNERSVCGAEIIFHQGHLTNPDITESNYIKEKTMQDSNSTATKADDTRLLKAVLMVGAIFCLGAGAIQFLFPGIDAILAEVEPGELDWIYRMVGSGYIGLGIGMLGVYRNPAGQGVFITMLIVMNVFVCVTFIITLLTASYFPIPAVLCVWIVILVLLVYARQMAKDIL